MLALKLHTLCIIVLTQLAAFVFFVDEKHKQKMLALKLHILCIIVLTQLAALGSGELPYFPIEISRTAATGHTAPVLFQYGTYSLGLTLWWYFWTWDETTSNGMPPGSLWLIWLGLVLLATFDDKKTWSLHMFGVAIMLFGCAILTLARGRRAWAPFLGGLAIYLFRVAMRCLVMTLADPNLKWSDHWRQPDMVKERHMQVMYYGARHLTPEAAEIVMPIFRISGVLQWVAFYAFTMIL